MVFRYSNYQILCLVYICFGASFYGYDTGITSSVLAYSSFLVYFKLDNNTIGAINTAYYAASGVGTFLNWYFPNKIGRLNALRLASVVTLVGITLQTAAQNYPMFMVGRLLGGLGGGSVFSLCPVYAGEIASPKIRGRVGALYALNISVAFMITEWLGLAFWFIEGNASWRTLFGLQFVVAICMILGSFFMPESPRWLILKDRTEDALKVFRRIHDNEGDEEFYHLEFNQIRAQIQQEKEESLGLKAIVKRKSYVRRIALIASFFFFQQCTGIIPLTFYQVFIYQTLGADAVLSLVLTGVWGTVSTVSVLTLGFFFDKIGRRNALFMGYSIMIPAAVIIVALWAAFEAGGSTNMGFAKGINVGIFLTSFGYSCVMNTFGPVYSAEIMPTEIRAAGVAIGYFTFNAITVLHLQTAPLAIATISWKYFLIFLMFDCLFVVLVYFFYPETKGKTLEQMAEVFHDVVADPLDLSGKQDFHESEKTTAHEELAEAKGTT